MNIVKKGVRVNTFNFSYKAKVAWSSPYSSLEQSGSFSAEYEFLATEGLPGPVEDARALPLSAQHVLLKWKRPKQLAGVKLDEISYEVSERENENKSVVVSSLSNVLFKTSNPGRFSAVGAFVECQGVFPARVNARDSLYEHYT